MHGRSALLCFVLAVLSMTVQASYVTSNILRSETGCIFELDYLPSSDLASERYGAPISPLKASLTLLENGVRFHVTDAKRQRWEVPDIVVGDETPVAGAGYTVRYAEQGEPFSLSVSRSAGNESVFAVTSLYFSDQFIQLGTARSDARVYGLGERVSPFQRPNNQYGTFNSDQGTPETQALYGTHPFMMAVRDNGHAHGLFMLNSNAQEAEVNDHDVVFKLTGGVIDARVFVGPTPKDVTQQYHSVIGHPYMPSYWTLGYHQCAWGYKDVSDIDEVVSQFDKHNIPIDTLWADIDYMENFKLFTCGPGFECDRLGDFVSKLHDQKRQFVPIVDPGVRIERGYNVYENGLAAGVFVKDYDNETFAVAKVWPGLTHMPDWTNPATPAYWEGEIKDFHEKVPFDGLWIDMNEVASFCDGRCFISVEEEEGFGDGNTCRCAHPLPESARNFPAFMPAGMQSCRVHGQRLGLDCGTMNMDAVHHGGLEYDLHSLFGHQEGVLTADALVSVRGNKRPFVITRASFAGTGRYIGHWLGDNYASFESMAGSVPGMLDMNLFGIPLVGADICGFGGDTNEELCARWYQLGAFYPFMRNHKANDTKSQEPYALGPTVLDVSRRMIGLRYTLLPYYYTLFHDAHANGGAVIRSLMYEFPDYSDGFAVDSQFLVGPALLVSPVLAEGHRSVNAYFPGGEIWYDYFSGKALDADGFVELDAPLEHVNVHHRGGHIIPHQEVAHTSAAARWTPFTLVVALDANGAAQGSLYLDDGDTVGTWEAGVFTELQFTAQSSANKSLVVSSRLVNHGFAAADDIALARIIVLGYTQGTEVTWVPSQLRRSPVNVNISSAASRLVVDCEPQPITTPFSIELLYDSTL